MFRQRARIAGDPAQTDAFIRCPAEQDQSKLTCDIVNFGKAPGRGLARYHDRPP
jgi:hypothetical protein